MNQRTRLFLDETVDIIWGLSDAPKIARSIIFDLATSGGIEPQLESDRHSDELLDLIEKHGIPKQDESGSGWLKTKLSMCAEIYNGNSTSADEKAALAKNVRGLNYITTKDVGYGFQPINSDTGLKVGTNSHNLKIAPKNSVVICLEGGSAGKKMGLVEQDICFGNKLFALVCKEWARPKFLLIYFLSSKFQSDFQSQMSGIIGGISKSKFQDLTIHIPSLSEQDRIIQRVELLIGICDQLEQLNLQFSNLSTKARASSIDALVSSESEGEFRFAWDRLQNNWDLLSDTTEGIQTLRTLILDLAAHGQLVAGDLSDKSVQSLLEENKTPTVKKSTSKNAKPFLPPFLIPPHWAWSTIGELCKTQTGATPKTLQSDNQMDTIQYVTAANMVRFRAVDANFVPIESAKRAGRIAQENSVLFVGIGATIGKLCVIDTPSTFNQQIHSATPKFMNAHYLAFVMASGYFSVYCKERTNATAIPILNKSNWESIPIPVPPLKEQLKIVETVNGLLEFCDKLQKSLGQRETVARKFIGSLGAPQV